MTQKKKIMIVCDKKFPLAELSTAAFNPERYDITFIYLFHKSHTDQNQGPVKYIYLNASNKFFWRTYIVCRLLRLCLDIKPDVIITHAFKPFSITCITTQLINTKKIAVFHGLLVFERKSRVYFARIFAKNWQMVGVSQATCESLKTQLHDKRKRYHVIYNAIDLNASAQALLPRPQARTQLALAPNTFVFGMIARVVPKKGHIHLIDAFNQLALPNTELVIIGEGRLQNELAAYAATLATHKQIIFTGYKAKAAQYMRALDVFVLPSLSEAFGMVLLEAMVAQVPMIASHSGGISEVVGDENMLIPCGNTAALQEKMHEFYELSVEKRAQMGAALYQRLEQHFTEKTYWENYRALVDND